MVMNTSQFNRLKELLTPIFTDEPRRRTILDAAFFESPHKYNAVSLNGASLDFTSALLRHLNNTPADLLALLEAVQGFEGDIARQLQPFVENLREVLSKVPPTPNATPHYRLFITYRREDWAFAHRLANSLRERLNADVFVDFSGIDADEFERAILHHLRQADCLIVVVTAKTFSRRIFQRKDWVRRELREALQQGKPILQAAGDGLFAPANLPPDIRAVTGKQGIEFIPRFWDAAIDDLVKLIPNAIRNNDREPPPPLPEPTRLPFALIAALTGVALLIVFGLLALSNTPNPTPTVTHTTLSPSATSIPAGTSNRLWTHVEQVINGVPMVYVPRGCFEMGISEAERDILKPTYAARHDNEVQQDAQAIVCISEPFWIDKYEVTNAQYQRFVDAGGYTRREFWTEAGWAWRRENSITAPRDYEGLTNLDRPRVGITWYEAYAYAKWRGGRLPTEAEWEYAARGPESWRYTWGNDFNGENLNFCDKKCPHGWIDETVDDGYERTAPVGSYPNGQSWVGALDILGNAWEWTNSQEKAYSYREDDGREAVDESYNKDGIFSRIKRGGAWTSDEGFTRSSARGGSKATERANDTGFRVVVPIPR